MFVSLLFAWTVYAAPSEKSVIQSFDKAHGIYEKFLSDTMKYRSETEAYNEKEFEPAVEGMIVLLDGKKCQKCIPPYLKSLSHLDGSASENLTDQLKRIISKHPALLNAGCKKVEVETRKKLSTRLSDAITFLTNENKVDRKSIEKGIGNCLL